METGAQRDRRWRAAAGGESRKESNSKSPLGEQFSYTKGRDRVVISTAYIERPEERRPTTEIPYGFQGKGNRFVSTINGETFFYVVTLHAPQPR